MNRQTDGSSHAALRCSKDLFLSSGSNFTRPRQKEKNHLRIIAAGMALRVVVLMLMFPPFW